MIAETKTDSLTRRIRKASGMTQPEFADKIGCSVLTVKRCEKTGGLPVSKSTRRNMRMLAHLNGLAVPELENE